MERDYEIWEMREGHTCTHRLHGREGGRGERQRGRGVNDIKSDIITKNNL